VRRRILLKFSMWVHDGLAKVANCRICRLVHYGRN